MSCSDDDDLTVDNHGDRVINSNTLKKLPLQEVDRVPTDIDGACGYSLSASSLASLHEKCRDGRPWKKDSGTKWKDYDKVRYKNCKGSLKCPNLHCVFLVQYLTENQLKFDKNQMCTLCGAQGGPYVCAVRKYTAIKDVTAHIYHIGYHTGKPKIVNERQTDMVAKAIAVDTPPPPPPRVDPTVKPSAIQGNVVLTMMRQ